MRLNVSPKVAIDKIDALVREGADMLSWLYDAYDDLGEKMKEETEAYEHALDERLERIKQKPDYIPMRVGGIEIGSVPNTAKLLELSQPKPVYLGPRPTKVGWQGIEDMEKHYDKWRARTKAALEEIFTDFSPVYAFLNASGEWSSHPMDRVFEKYINMRRSLEAKVDKLISFYEALARNIRNPLVFLPKQAKLCFYDLVCPLVPDKNEAILCSYLFGFGVGETVEMLDAFNYMKGTDVIKLDAKSKGVVLNACDGINRKTKESFGFPIISRAGVTLRLSLPSRVTQSFS